MRNYIFVKILFLITFIFFANNSFLYAGIDGIDVDLQIGSCNNNGTCEAGEEDFFICPADCTPVAIPPSSGTSSSGSLLAMDNVFNNLTVEVSYTTATIKWHSVIPTTSNVKWGTSPDYKDGVVRNINYLLDHKVLITDLKEGTLHYFNIEAENLLEKTNYLENQIFRTLSPSDTTPPANVTKVKVSSTFQGVTISWINPKDPDFDYVRVLKNTDRFYSSPFIGKLVYEGRGNYFLDSNIHYEKKYFYSLWSRDRAGNYSTGALVDIIHNGKSDDTLDSNLTLKEVAVPLHDVFIVTEGTSSHDFNMGSVFHLSGDYPINIKSNYSSTIKNDDMWVVIRNNKNVEVSKYFFSRIKDKDGFINVNIPTFDDGGYYNVSIYRYYNNDLQLVRKGVFQINKTQIPNEIIFPWRVILQTLSVIFIIPLIRVFFLIFY